MTVLDDPSLIARSRSGDAEAYGQLYERHVDVALGVARRITDRDAEDVVSDAFARTFAVLREGGGPDVAFRPYVLRAVRNAAVDRHRREGRVAPVAAVGESQTPLHQDERDGDPVVDRLERELAVRAFESLPERWQTVLWHTEVQGETPAQVAPLLGISPRAVAQLAVRAREGLRTAWVGEHARRVPADHRQAAAMLAPSVRSSLGRRDRRALDEHLAGCRGCREVRDELVDVNGALRAHLLPAVLGLTATQLGWLPHATGGAAAGVAGAGASTSGTSGGGGASSAGAGGGAGGTGGGAAAGTSGAGGHGLVAAVSGTLSQPVAAGVVALAVAVTGVGSWAVWDAQREPRTSQVSTSAAARDAEGSPDATSAGDAPRPDQGATSGGTDGASPGGAVPTGTPAPQEAPSSPPSGTSSSSTSSSSSDQTCEEGGSAAPPSSSTSSTGSSASSTGSSASCEPSSGSSTTTSGSTDASSTSSSSTSSDPSSTTSRSPSSTSSSPSSSSTTRSGSTGSTSR